MSIKKILEEDWSDYDSRKIQNEEDTLLFSCSDTWEMEYLRNKIKKYCPRLSDAAIQSSIDACCASFGSMHPRKKFVERVGNRLSISTN